MIAEKPKKCPRCRLAMYRAEHERGRPFRCSGCKLAPDVCRCHPAQITLIEFEELGEVLKEPEVAP